MRSELGEGSFSAVIRELGLSIPAVLLAVVISFAAVAADDVTFPGAKADAYESVDEVSGTLQLPEGAKRMVPAVVILHGSGGIDGRGAFYAEALNKAGFATLELFMFVKGGRPSAGHMATLTHAYGALKYLAGHPDINPKAIGVMGFSWGGGMSMRMASKSVTEAFMPGDDSPRFAAHAPMYPVCGGALRRMSDPRQRGYADFDALTGAPVLILAGGKDDYDEPDSCQKFLAALPESTRSHITLQYYPDATHGWDTRGGPKKFYDRFAHNGKGGTVYFEPNQEAAKDSRAKIVEFFTRTLRGAK